MADTIIAPDQLWRGKGNGSGQVIRIVRVAVDRTVTFVRTQGSPASSLGKEARAPLANVETAFEYTGETESPFL